MHHPLRGGLFESFVISDLLKARFNYEKLAQVSSDNSYIVYGADQKQKQFSRQLVPWYKLDTVFGNDEGHNVPLKKRTQ